MNSGSGTMHQEDVKENADMSSVKKCVIILTLNSRFSSLNLVAMS